MKVKKTYQAAGRHVILKADRDLFAKLILVAQTRQLEMKEVLKHRLGPIPWALASDILCDCLIYMKYASSNFFVHHKSPQSSLPLFLIDTITETTLYHYRPLMMMITDKIIHSYSYN